MGRKIKILINANAKAILSKRKRNKSEIAFAKEIIKKVNPEILKLRQKVAAGKSDMIASLVADIQEGYSPIVVICGRPRRGKTFTAAVIANLISAFLYYQYWNPEKNYHFTPKEMIEAMEDAGFEIKLADEAGAIGSGINRREWFSQLNKSVDYILQTQGILQNIIIFILPIVSDLSIDVRKYIDWLVVMKKRGVAVCYKIDKKEGQLVKDLSDFRKIYIETLTIKKSDLLPEIWKYIDDKSRLLKIASRKNVIADLNKTNDKDTDNWLKGALK